MSVHPLIQKIEAAELRSAALPSFSPGDTVRVNVRILDGEKERIQAYEGVVISIKGASNRRSFTVRKISQGFGVERVFPLHSPRISSLEVIRQGRVRRAKLYYLRNLRGKAARIRDKRTW
jgi:large subunit ribosomal protein L19